MVLIHESDLSKDNHADFLYDNLTENRSDCRCAFSANKYDELSARPVIFQLTESLTDFHTLCLQI